MSAAYEQGGTDAGPACTMCGGTVYHYTAHRNEDDWSWTVAIRCVTHNGEVIRYRPKGGRPTIDTVKGILADPRNW